MKASLIAFTAWASSASAIVTINLVSNPNRPLIHPRHLASRATITAPLGNNVTGGSYFAEVEVGTPPQRVLLALDTGSSDVWMLNSDADLCTSKALQAEAQSGCETTFDPTKSSTLKLVDRDGFFIKYADETGAQGDYITDDFSIGGAKIKGLQMGLAHNSTVTTGLLGIGYDTNVAALIAYPSIINMMESQGLINTRAYSLYLDDLKSSTGSIIFGGLDTDKYQGSLLQIPVIPELLRNGTEIFTHFEIPLTFLSITSASGAVTRLTSSTYNLPVILDSGTTLTYLPNRLVAVLYEAINAFPDPKTGLVYVSCSLRSSPSSPATTVNYNFGTPSANLTISVSAAELVFDLEGLFSLEGYVLPTLPFSDPCAFGIMPSGDGPDLLGDTFLRSAYVVYDLRNHVVAMAPTNFDSKQINLIEMQAGQTRIPDVSGIASGIRVTSTPTGSGNLGGGKATGALTSSRATGTGAASGSSTSKSAGTAVVPGIDTKGVLVLALAGFFTLLGAGLIWA